MQNERIDLKIGDRNYSMIRMSPLKGAAFGLKVSSALAKALSSSNAASSLKEIQGKLNSEISEDEKMTIGGMIVSLLSNVDSDLVFSIFKESILSGVYFNNVALQDEPEIESHFSQYPQDFYIIGAWAAFNHVRPFFKDIGDGILALLNKKEKEKESNSLPKSPSIIR